MPAHLQSILERRQLQVCYTILLQERESESAGCSMHPRTPTFLGLVQPPSCKREKVMLAKVKSARQVVRAPQPSEQGET